MPISVAQAVLLAKVGPQEHEVEHRSEEIYAAVPEHA